MAEGVIFGVMVTDEPAKAAVKAMIAASGVCALCQIVYATCQAAVTGKVVQEFVYLFCLLLIPVCGYNGAKKRVREHVSLFRTCSALQGLLFAIIAVNKFLDLKRAEENCYKCSTARINIRSNTTLPDDCMFSDWMGVERKMDDDVLKDCVNLANPVAEYVSIFLCVFLFPVLCFTGYTANKVLSSNLFVRSARTSDIAVVGVVEEVVANAEEVQLSEKV